MVILLFGTIYWRAKLVPRFHNAKPPGGDEAKEVMISAIGEAM
jgi:hypothetical protein